MPRKSSLKTLRLKAWKACSQYIRQFYSDNRGWTVCYTCGVAGEWKSMDAGHAMPGRSNSVLCDVEILRCQCKTCNIFKRGQHHIFAGKLIKENGLEWWEKKLSDSRKIVKYTRDDYIKLAESFTFKTQQLSVEKRSLN